MSSDEVEREEVVAFKRLIRSEQGAVSVYFIIIVIVIFILNCVLIDFARVIIAELETEKAVKKAARSVLSSYDSNMRKYGLFGLGIHDLQAREIARTILQENLAPASSAHAFQFIGTMIHPDTVRVLPIASLANHKIFKDQILETMKYIAPLEYTEHIMEALQPAKESAEKAEQFALQSAALEKLIKERDQKLEDAWQRVDQMVRLITSTYRSAQIDLSSLAVMQASLIEERERADPDPTGLDRELQQSRLLELETQVREAKQKLLERYATTHDQLNELHRQLADDLLEAEQLNAELVEEIKHINDSRQSSGEVLEGGSPEESFNHINILNDAYFAAYRTGEAVVLSQFGSLLQLVADHHYDTDWSQISETNDRVYRAAISWHANRLTDIQGRRDEAKRIKEMQDEEKAKWKSILNDLKSKVQISDCGEHDSEIYEALKGQDGLFRYYLNWNQLYGNGESAQHFSMEEEADQSASRSISWLTGLVNRVLDIRNDLYVNEYAMFNFNYRTLEHKDEAERWFQTAADPLTHPLQRQEVEYILYGLGSCTANQAAAYAEIFSIRLAIRTVEALSDPKKVAAGSPLLVFLIAVVEGATRAYQDMLKLIEGEKIPLSSKMGVAMLGYSDYLRIFFLLHPGMKHRLARMQALIQLNTGEDLSKQHAYLEVHTDASIRLWFIPQLMSMLNQANLLNGQIEGNRYVFTKKAAFTY